MPERLQFANLTGASTAVLHHQLPQSKLHFNFAKHFENIAIGNSKLMTDVWIGDSFLHVQIQLLLTNDRKAMNLGIGYQPTIRLGCK